MSPKQVEQWKLAWKISAETDQPIRPRRCSDYDKALSIAREMARDWGSAVMESRTHTLRVTKDGNVEQLRPEPSTTGGR